MNVEYRQVRVKGQAITVPSYQIADRTVIVSGRWIRLASIHEENTIEGEPVVNPEHLIQSLKQLRSMRPDIFTFAQSVCETSPKYPYYFEWDNAAGVPISTFDEWLGKRVATDVRQNVKKAAKRGVVVKSVPFDDVFVNGIVEIYNECPIRQGIPFWHYGKSFDVVKSETSHCLERSEFIGAYLGDELIGFIKLLYTGKIADIVLITSKQKYFDKRPTNALIGKAVEVCVQKNMSFLTYAKLVYGNKANSSLAEFKRRHGFEKIVFPRYYAPLTTKGTIALKLKLHRNITDLVPAKILGTLVSLRARFFKNRGLSLEGQLNPTGTRQGDESGRP